MLSDNVKRYLALIDTLKTIQTNKSSSIEDDENKILDTLDILWFRLSSRELDYLESILDVDV